jgi:thimet oligopeptidase
MPGEGIDRDDATRAKLRQLRGELISAGEWSQNIISGDRQIEVNSAAELDGLPADYVAAHPAGPNGRSR